MVTADDVLDYIRQAGPVLPKHVADAFSISTLFASAFLSELSSGGGVKASHLKIGGSPLYYTEEHRDRLVDYRGNLHEKEQKTFELLRGERVLDDSKLELLDRVALRKMEDFAIPLAVDVGGERRLFWRYYLVTDAEASERISALIAEGSSSQAVGSVDAAAGSSSSAQSADEQEAPSTVEDAAAPRDPPKAEAASEEPIEKSSAAPEPAKPVREEPARTSPEPVPAGEDSSAHRTSTATQTTSKPKEAARQETIAAKKPEPVRVRHAPDANEALEGDKLGDAVLAYFAERSIGLLYAEVARKNTACFGVARVPSAVGEAEYYFYAKDKKSITDKDVKEAYAESAILGYPLLYLAKGSIAKSATELVGSKIKSCVLVEL